MLSRLPLPESPPGVPLPGETILLLEHLQSFPITAVQIKKWTNQDPVLSRVRNFVYNKADSHLIMNRQYLTICAEKSLAYRMDAFCEAAE